MIKRLIIALLVALPISALAQKFGVVDTNAIFQDMPEVEAMNKQLEETQKQYEDELVKLNTEYQKKAEEFQTLINDETTPDAIKQRRYEEIQELENKAGQFAQSSRQALQRLQEQLFTPIQQKLVDAIKAVGQEGSYTFIFQSVEPAYVGTDVVDVTPQVKAKLGIK